MKVNITTRHIDNRREAMGTKSYAMKKVPRLERYMDSRGEPSEVNIILSAEKLRNTAEIIINSGDIKATAAVELEDMHAAIDKVFDAIVKQLRRRTDKRATTRRRASAKKNLDTENSRSNNNNVLEKKLPAKPMSLDEAILQLSVSNDNYVVFRNSETLEMNVVYKEKSSKNVNLIIP